MTKVVFFGASVTAQKNGYATYYKKMNPEICIEIFGYGSTQIYNAGVCNVDKVLECNPDIVMFDFIGSVVFNMTNDEILALENILRKIGQKQCKIVFLIMCNNVMSNQFAHIDQCKKYKLMLEKYKTNYLDMYQLLTNDKKYSDINIQKMFRDLVHTTEYGSEVYAQLISEHIKFETLGMQEIIPDKNKYFNIKNLDVSITAYKYVKLEGNCKIIGIDQKIGPHSAIVKIDDGKNIKEFNLWDQWSYFTRNNIKLKCDVNGIVTLSITDKEFDRSVAKIQKEWNDFPKCMIFHTIFYIGDNLRLIEYV